MRYTVELSVNNPIHISMYSHKAEAKVVVLVVRVVVVPVAHLHVVRIVVPTSAPIHAVGAAFNTVPLYNLLLSKLLP